MGKNADLAINVRTIIQQVNSAKEEKLAVKASPMTLMTVVLNRPLPQQVGKTRDFVNDQLSSKLAVASEVELEVEEVLVGENPSIATGVIMRMDSTEIVKLLETMVYIFLL